MNLAFLGGTFDPPHIGHLWIAKQVEEQFHLKVRIVPNSQEASKAWGKDKVSSEYDRLNMCKLAANAFNLTASPIEIQNQFLYTYQTVQYFKENFPGIEEFYWIVGSDWGVKINQFKKFEELEKICKFIILKRPGEEIDPYIKYLLELRINIQVSSTDIRTRVKEGYPITGLVTPEVEEYIKNKNLYKE